MKAILITRPGGPDVLEMGDVDMPTLEPGHLLVRVHATALNRADILQRKGQYPAPAGAPQNIPGLEYAGTVQAMAPDAGRWQPGARVMGLVGGGGYAQYVSVHEDEVLRVPDRWTLEQAAAIPEAFLTAHDALFTLMQLRATDKVVIHAVASGVGTAALQLARAGSAVTIGTSRSSAKLEQVRELGLDFAIDVTGSDFATEVLRITNDSGANGVLDLVGGDYLGGDVRCLTERGRLILVGLTAGATAQLDMRTVLRKRLSIIGTVMRARSLEEKIAVVRAFELAALPWLDAGIIRPVIDRILPIDQAAHAHRALENNETVGKIVLTWPD